MFLHSGQCPQNSDPVTLLIVDGPFEHRLPFCYFQPQRSASISMGAFPLVLDSKGKRGRAFKGRAYGVISKPGNVSRNFFFASYVWHNVEKSGTLEVELAKGAKAYLVGERDRALRSRLGAVRRLVSIDRTRTKVIFNFLRVGTRD